MSATSPLVILAKFALDYPIFQAPTGSIAGPELASAVSEAGGMGAMGLPRIDARQPRHNVSILPVRAGD